VPPSSAGRAIASAPRLPTAVHLSAPAAPATLPVTPTAHVALAKSPTARGNTASGRLVITTPLGSMHIGDLQQQSRPVCVAGIGTCG
jgi:hypothetical protein